MSEWMERVDSDQAQQILRAVVGAYRGQMVPGELTETLRQELALAFEVSETQVEPTSEGDIARNALQVLAEDPQQQIAIETMAAQPEIGRQRYDFGAGIALTAAVMMVLQTHMRFERKADGTWTVLVEKKPTKDALVKGLVQKLLAYVK